MHLGLHRNKADDLIIRLRNEDGTLLRLATGFQRSQVLRGHAVAIEQPVVNRPFEILQSDDQLD